MGDLLERICRFVDELNLFSAVNLGKVPRDGGISINQCGGEGKRFLTGGGYQRITIEVVVRHRSMQTTLDACWQIHTLLASAKSIPFSDGKCIFAGVVKPPEFSEGGGFFTGEFRANVLIFS